MKRQIVTSFAVVLALVAIQSCQKESVVGKIDPEAQKAGIMRVKAGEPETKTYIFENGTDLNKTSYGLGWSAGDAIGCYEVSTVSGTPTIQTTRVTSSPLADDASSATFTMDFSGNSGKANFSYIFVYPAASYTVKNEANGTYRGIIPQKQTFALNSFDKNADLLVSEPIMNQPSRPTDVSARFERIGSTVLMNIKAPTTDEVINKITFSTSEENIKLQGYYEIRPLDGEYDIAPYFGSNSLELTPANTTIYSGTIPVWFRCSATTLSDNFTVVVTTDKKTYTKTVDLTSRHLEFENAGLTKFNVNMKEVTGDLIASLESDGDYFITGVKSNKVYAATKYVSGNNLSSPLEITVDKGNETITYVSGIEDCLFTFTRVTTGDYAGKYTIVDAGGKYLYSAGGTGGSSKNYLKGKDAPGEDGNAYWSIVKNDDGTYSIESVGDADKKIMRFNENGSNNPMFSCYASGQNPITLYPDSWCPGIDKTPVITFEDSEKTKNVSANATSVVFNYSANKYVTSLPTVSITSDEDGIIDGDPVVAAGTITVTLVENTESSAKTATLSVSGTGLASAVTLTINQAAASSGGEDPEPVNKTYSFAFTTIGSTGWTNSYADHDNVYNDDYVSISLKSASKQTSNVTDYPVTKAGDVIVILKDGTMSAVTFNLTQWTTKAKTVSLQYSTNGGSTFSALSPAVSSSNFTLSSSSLPTGTNAVKMVQGDTGNQVGLTGVSFTYTPSN